MKKTRLFNGVMAILKGENWIIISPNFDEVLRIPKKDIDDPKILQKLKDRDFFKIKQRNEVEVSLATLITTDACNLRCLYCFADSGSNFVTKLMSHELAFASVDRAAKSASGKKLLVAFFGGEPTLTQNLIKDVVSYARDKAKNSNILGVEFSITTNGFCSEKFLKYLVDNEFRITLSSDGASYVQDYQRPCKNGEASSGVVEKTIRYLTSRDADFKIRTTVTEYSVSQMAKTVKWLSFLGGKRIQFEPISIAGRALSQNSRDGINRPSADEFVKNLKNAIIEGANCNVEILNSSYMNLAEPPRKFCDGNINNRFAVSYTGDITTCVEVQDKHHSASPDFIVGHYDEKISDFIITKEKDKTACQTLQQGIGVKYCGDCFARNICGGGCPVRNFHTTGKTSIIDPYRCQIIREMLPFVVGLIDQATYE